MYYKEMSGKIIGPAVARNRSNESQLTIHRGLVLAITFIVYATYHASRKPISIVKVAQELHRSL